MSRKINNLPFKIKMMGSYVLTSVLPFLIAALISGSVMVSQTKHTSILFMHQIISQVGNSIDMYVQSMDKIAGYLAGEVGKDNNLSCNKNKLSSILQNLIQATPEIAGILFVFADDTSVSIGMSRISRDPFLLESWYQSAVGSGGNTVLVSSPAGRNLLTNYEDSVDDIFSLAKAVFSPLDGSLAGVILLDIRHNIIRDSINSVSIGNAGFVFVIDADDNVIYSPANKIVYRIPANILKTELSLSRKMKPLELKIRDKRFQIDIVYSNYTGWRTVGVFPSGEFRKNFSWANLTLIISMICILLLIFSVSLFFSNTITKPILKLQNLMQKAETGNLTVRFRSLYTDEIGNLGTSFNHMLEQLDRLVKQVYKEQRDKKEAEIKILQEQIKPHFLYNTLDTISWLAREKGALDIVKLVDALTNMFRAGLSKGKDFISLKEELKHVGSYLYIQQIRYNDKLSYSIETDDFLNNCLVPRILLQPLVENAIYHGIKQKRNNGMIKVHVEKITENNLPMLVLSVYDNGVGIPQDKLLPLQKLLEMDDTCEEKTGFGLYYVAKRIFFAYGPPYRITIESSQSKGTTVALYLPFQREVPAE